MDPDGKTILVTGGTGRQGGAVARHLLAEGWHVRALVRDPHKPAASELESLGASLVVGDLLDRPSLDGAAIDAYGVYSVQSPAGGLESEVAQGVNLAEAASAAGVAHFVYSSVRGASSDASMPFMESKAIIEQRIVELGLPATVWRPVSFMENFLRQRDEIASGHLGAPVEPEAVRQFVAVDDIGRFVALAFGEPERYVGVVKEIASDEMTMPEAAALFSAVLDIPVVFEQTEPPPSMTTVRAPRPGVPGLPMANLAELRQMVPDLMTLEQWICGHEWT